MPGGRELLSLPQVQQWGLDVSQPSNLAFPLTVLHSGTRGFPNGGLCFGHPLSQCSSARPPLQILRPIIPTGTPSLVLHHASFFCLRSLVTMDTMEKVPLPTEAHGWHSDNERINEKGVTGDLGSSPYAVSYLQKGFEGAISP